MKYQYRRWTIEEDKLLRKLYQKKTLKELALIFDRSYTKICRRAILLGIKKNKKSISRFVSMGLKKLYREGGRTNKGSKNPNWKGGKKIEFGYEVTYMPNYKGRLRSGRYVATHRLVMEKHIGRQLLDTEIVHHINRNRLDNRIENLQLLPNISKHIKLHKEQSKKNLLKTPSHIKHNGTKS